MYHVRLATMAVFSFTAILPAMAACGGDNITGAAQDVLNPTLDGVEKVNKWKDGAPEEMRFEKCLDEGGQWVSELKISACEDGNAQIDADGIVTVQPCGQGHEKSTSTLQCLHRDTLGRVYYNDGPSVPPAMLTISSWIDPSIDQMRYNRLFWQAGVLHDNCYHNNPITYGLTREDCDERFIEDLMTSCLYHQNAGFDWFKKSVCQTYATLMYGMVRKHGGENFDGVNLEAQYEIPQPLFVQYGMDASPYNDACKTDIKDFLVKFKILPDSPESD